MDIIIKSSQFNHPDKYERILGVVDYLNNLRDGFFTDEELDHALPQAQQVYFCDLYYCQVENGGLMQFFTNTNFDPSINNFILIGLERMNALKNKELFSKALLMMEQTEDDSIYEILDDLTDRFYHLEASESIVDLNYNYIETLEHLKVVPDDDYQAELAAVLSTITDYEERKIQAAKNWDENKPRYYIVAEELCHKYGLVLVSINMMDYGDGIVSDEQANKNEVLGEMYYHLTTDQGYYYVIDTGSLATLVQGDNHYVLGTISVDGLMEK